MKKRGRAQASMEYLMIVGLVFVIIVPMIYLFYSYSTEVSGQVTETKVNKIANDIVNNAEEVFYLGEPSKTTLGFDIPQGVFDVDVSPDGKELVFRVGDRYAFQEVVAYSNVALTNYLVTPDLVPGKRRIRIGAQAGSVVLYTGNITYAKSRWCAYDLAEQIMERAFDVAQQRKGKALSLSVDPVCVPLINTLSMTDSTISVNVNTGDTAVDFNIDSFVSLKEENSGDVAISSPDYDIFFSNGNMEIGSPKCRDADGDGYGIVEGSSACDPDIEFDCDDDTSNDPPSTVCPTSTSSCTTTSAYCAICIHPGAAEYPADGVDSNCNGNKDT